MKKKKQAAAQIDRNSYTPYLGSPSNHCTASFAITGRVQPDLTVEELVPVTPCTACPVPKSATAAASKTVREMLMARKNSLPKPVPPYETIYDRARHESTTVRPSPLDPTATTRPAHSHAGSRDWHTGMDVVIRNEAWAADRDQKLLRGRIEREVREVEGCTFRPVISTTSGWDASSKLETGRAAGQLSSAELRELGTCRSYAKINEIRVRSKSRGKKAEAYP